MFWSQQTTFVVALPFEGLEYLPPLFALTPSHSSGFSLIVSATWKPFPKSRKAESFLVTFAYTAT